MAAYLVGTRGTPVHAIGLGLSVSASHTLGILALAAVIVGAQGVLNPDLVVRSAPVLAAAGIVAIGGWMLISELAHGVMRPAEPPRHGTSMDTRPRHTTTTTTTTTEPPQPRRRPPQPPARAGTTVTWRSLFVLGLAGGLIPSTSALLILLGAIAGGRSAFGVVLVVAFGLGMAAVMTASGSR